MGKLHELLAVEQDLMREAKKTLDEAIRVFGRKELFTGLHKRLEMIEEGRDAEEKEAEEYAELTTTANEITGAFWIAATRYYDALLQKESANQEATADVIIGEQTIASGLPATFLLGMEARLNTIRALYEAMPTLAPGTVWEPDEQKRTGAWRATRPEIRRKTEKVVKHSVVYKATVEHPAQVETWNVDEMVGTFTTEMWSGAVPQAEKLDKLVRLDRLIRAIKQARQRANTVEVKPLEIGKRLSEYINTGK